MSKLSSVVGAIKRLGQKEGKRSSSLLQEEVDTLRRQNTELQKQLNELQLFRDLVDASNDAVYIVDPGSSNFLEVNRQACEVLGYSHEELLGLRVIDVDYTLQSSEDWADHVQQLRKEDSLVLDSIHRKKDGDLFPVEVNIRLITRNQKSYIIAISRDVSELRFNREKLIEEKNKLEAVLAALGDGLTVQDTNFRVLYQNAVHRCKQGDQTGRYCYEAYQGKSSVCEGCLLTKCFADGLVHRRETSATTDNGLIHMEVSASPVRDAHGNIVAGVETVRDITDRKCLEDQLLQAQKMEAVGRLTSGIAHDFNNLLTTIVGYSDLLLMDLAENASLNREELQKEILSIREAGGKATRLTRQLLAFSRKQVLELKVVDLNQLVENMVKILGRLIGDDIQLEMKLKPDLGHIKADPGQLEQVLMNLAVNARDAMPQGGCLYIETGEVALDEKADGGRDEFVPGPYASLLLRDTGEGIALEDQEKIFDPFFTTKPIGKGTGLGLATVHGIVKQHNGLISVSSEPGRGTTFHLLFPVTGEEVEDYEQLQKPAVLHGRDKIMVVDDDSGIRSLILDTLRPLGFEVLEAGSGEEALRICRDLEDPPVLLLTDIVMPEMNGHQLARHLAETYPEMKVVFMSGYAEAIVAGDSPGVEINFLRKPIIPSVLIDKLQEVLERS